MLRRLATFGVVAVALAALYLAAVRTQPGRQAAATVQPGTTTAVTSVTRSCPPPGPNTGTARIALVAEPGQNSGGQGTAQLSAIPSADATSPAGKPATGTGTAGGTGAAITTPGALALQAAPQSGQYGGTAVAATGAMAEGFEAEQATASGVGIVSCGHAGSDMWFVGTGVTAGAPATRLYLMNTGQLAASVDVTLITDAGIQPGLSAAITVGPGQYLWEDLAQHAHGSVVLGVHVQTSSGQVAADVWQGPSSGSGGTWLPQAAAPSTQVILPGLTGAGSAARLLLLVPGSTDAKVRVEALTSHGPFLPFGTAAQDAPAAASSSFTLTPLGVSAASLVLTSNVPITAAIAVPGSGIGAFSAAVAPVTGQGVIAGNPGGKQDSVAVVLTAPAGAASATITVLPSSTGSTASGAAAPAPQVVQVPAGHTTGVTVAPPAGGQPFAIVVTPSAGSGPLYAARVVTSGSSALSGQVLSILPVPSAPTQITLPPATDSYTAILP